MAADWLTGGNRIDPNLIVSRADDAPSHDVERPAVRGHARPADDAHGRPDDDARVRAKAPALVRTPGPAAEPAKPGKPAGTDMEPKPAVQADDWNPWDDPAPPSATRMEPESVDGDWNLAEGTPTPVSGIPGDSAVDTDDWNPWDEQPSQAHAAPAAPPSIDADWNLTDADATWNPWDDAPKDTGGHAIKAPAPTDATGDGGHESTRAGTDERSDSRTAEEDGSTADRMPMGTGSQEPTPTDSMDGDERESMGAQSEAHPADLAPKGFDSNESMRTDGEEEWNPWDDTPSDTRMPDAPAPKPIANSGDGVHESTGARTEPRTDDTDGREAEGTADSEPKTKGSHEAKPTDSAEEWNPWDSEPATPGVRMDGNPDAGGNGGAAPHATQHTVSATPSPTDADATWNPWDDEPGGTPGMETQDATPEEWNPWDDGSTDAADRREDAQPRQDTQEDKSTPAPLPVRSDVHAPMESSRSGVEPP
ncbi:hypothetical protein CLV65_1617, partial [Pseudoscardovia suis]